MNSIISLLLLPSLLAGITEGFSVEIATSGTVFKTGFVKAKQSDKKVWVDRTWKGGLDRMKVNIIEPVVGTSKGTVFFMHGFFQYPEAYIPSLESLAEELSLTVVAVRTDLVSKQVLQTLHSNILQGDFEKGLEYCLQQAVAEDTIQCIEMAKQGKWPFEFLKGKPMGVFGHSMGGGLSFYVSEKANLDYIGCLAPVVGVDNFAPTTAMEGGGPKNALLVAGGCDIIARPKSVESIYDDCRSKGTKAIYAVIEEATHTGFEDELDIIVPTALSNLLDLFNISKITQSIVSTARRLATKDEIVLSRLLMSYVFSSMLSRKSLSMDEAEQFISNNSDMSGRLIMK